MPTKKFLEHKSISEVSTPEKSLPAYKRKMKKRISTAIKNSLRGISCYLFDNNILEGKKVVATPNQTSRYSTKGMYIFNNQF